MTPHVLAPRAPRSIPQEQTLAGVATARPVPPSRWEAAAIIFFVLFLLVFPKGGIKIAGVPLTWGYLGFAPVLLWFAVQLARGQRFGIARTRLVVLALLVPFQLVSWLALVVNGIDGMGFGISFLVTFFVVPPLFVLVFGVTLDRIEHTWLLRWIRYGILFIAVYGILLFCYRLGTGRFFEVPLLTVNLGDLGDLDSKYNDRGGIFKLISTYNNGNLYGISVLILLPLYCWLEPRWTRRWLVKLSLLLTLSRTVWVGLLLFEVLWRGYVQRISLRAAAILLASVAVTLAGIWLALDLMGREPAAFLFDANLGGRFRQLRALENAGLLPTEPFTEILEIVYLSIFQVLGLVGLATFLLAMLGPLVLHWTGVLPGTETSYKRALAAGLMVYLLVATSDGALLYIPVMAIYWFTASLLLSHSHPAGHPAQQQGVPTVGAYRAIT